MSEILNYFKNNLWNLIFVLPAILFVITIHEYAHGKMADILGDPTPRMTGRLSLNPLKHLDPIGTLALIIFRFGWAKPVLVDFYSFRNPKRDITLVSLAGPFANFIAAGIFSLILLIFKHSPFLLVKFNYVVFFINQIIMYNMFLGIFNLLPIPPLDGSKAFFSLLFKYPQRYISDRTLDIYGTIVLLILLYTGVLGKIMYLIINPLLNFLLV